MTISDFVMIFAVLAGPIFAIQIQKYLESKHETKERKLKIFKALMATRGSTLSPLHVEALNCIILEFSPNKKKEKEVLEQWKIYFDNLYNYISPDDPDYKIKNESLNSERKNLLANLLKSMSECFDYDFDKVLITKGAYTPTGHINVENDHHIIRNSLVELLTGNKSLSVCISKKHEDRHVHDKHNAEP